LFLPGGSCDPAQKLAVAVSVTSKENASIEGNFSTDPFKEIAEYEARFSR
jgi:hypothetical protein